MVENVLNELSVKSSQYAVVKLNGLLHADDEKSAYMQILKVLTQQTDIKRVSIPKKECIH